jgi:hypothetical protein
MAEDAVLESFRGKVAAGDISGIRVRVRVAGGMPEEQHVDRTIEVDSSGAAAATAAADDAAGPAEERGDVPEEDLSALMRELSEGAEGLVPRSQARFLPDSLVGSVVLEVDGDTTELFYLADEQDRITQNKPIPPAAASALDQLQRLGDRLVGPAPELEGE